MDDKNFDNQSAYEWINAIESKKSSKRDDDIYPRINQWLREFEIKNVLDLGSGQGVCTEKLNLADREYTGVEPSSFLLTRAKELYPNYQFINGNAYHLPFAEESFDGVFSIAVWHLLQDINQAHAELNRVLRKDGKFLIITANPNNRADWIASYEKVEEDGSQLIGINTNEAGVGISDTLFLRSKEELLQTLDRNNLKVTNTESIRIWMLIEGG
ncbi:MAG: class I SAM-dependent methyltransferase [Bacteriovoracaceae bacterium]|nr:class I SAM-dependent methyltransferase [Bacteriovoracaceae bacterium]